MSNTDASAGSESVIHTFVGNCCNHAGMVLATGAFRSGVGGHERQSACALCKPLRRAQSAARPTCPRASLIRRRPLASKCDEPRLKSIIDGKFAIDAIAGEGGFGVVYSDVHLGFELPIAVSLRH